jgi:uncharacterized protein YndB with AHSA1/START domain
METTNQHQVIVTAEPGKQELFITREFDAPREMVFKAFIDPELLIQWLGPKSMVMSIDAYEMKNGGWYRYVHTDERGNHYAFRGAVHEVYTPERIIQTFEFEGIPGKGHVSLDTSFFEELSDGRTKLTIHSVFRTVADRDGMVSSGMEGGLTEGFARLDELLAS